MNQMPKTGFSDSYRTGNSLITSLSILLRIGCYPRSIGRPACFLTRGLPARSLLGARVSVEGDEEIPDMGFAPCVREAKLRQEGQRKRSVTDSANVSLFSSFDGV